MIETRAVANIRTLSSLVERGGGRPLFYTKIAEKHRFRLILQDVYLVQRYKTKNEQSRTNKNTLFVWFGFRVD